MSIGKNVIFLCINWDFPYDLIHTSVSSFPDWILLVLKASLRNLLSNRSFWHSRSTILFSLLCNLSFSRLEDRPLHENRASCIVRGIHLNSSQAPAAVGRSCPGSSRTNSAKSPLWPAGTSRTLHAKRPWRRS